MRKDSDFLSELPPSTVNYWPLLLGPWTATLVAPDEVFNGAFLGSLEGATYIEITLKFKVLE